jgi:hypothetical protein
MSASANVIATELSAKQNTFCIVFDINIGCTAFYRTVTNTVLYFIK